MNEEHSILIRDTATWHCLNYICILPKQKRFSLSLSVCVPGTSRPLRLYKQNRVKSLAPFIVHIRVAARYQGFFSGTLLRKAKINVPSIVKPCLQMRRLSRTWRVISVLYLKIWQKTVYTVTLRIINTNWCSSCQIARLFSNTVMTNYRQTSDVYWCISCIERLNTAHSSGSQLGLLTIT